MIKLITKRLKNNKGFTLVELIVVIAILGVLSAIAVPRLSNSLDTAKLNTDYTNAEIIAKQIIIAHLEGNLDNLFKEGVNQEEVLDEDSEISIALIESGYLDSMPKIQSKTSDSEYFTLKYEYDEEKDKIISIKIINGNDVFYPKQE